jgi:hypothetical protein
MGYQLKITSKLDFGVRTFCQNPPNSSQDPKKFDRPKLLSKLLSTTSAAPSSSLIVALSSLIKP